MNVTKAVLLGLGLMIGVSQADPASAQGRGYACEEFHAARQFGCNAVEGSRPTVYNTIEEGAYKMCTWTFNQDLTCEEREKATHTIFIWKDPKCTILKRKIRVGQLRCD
jgi:hypothetical protein